MSGKIMPNRLDRVFYQYQEELESKALEVLRSGWYVLGPEVESFEREFADYTGSKYCVGLASGLDALWLAFRVLGIGSGDEVLVQANTYIASVMGITINGATPIFVEPDVFYNLDASHLEEYVTDRTKAILVVHLYGQASHMEEILRVCQKHHLRLVEDCAQSHGACFHSKPDHNPGLKRPDGHPCYESQSFHSKPDHNLGIKRPDGHPCNESQSFHCKMTGTFGDIGCFSFYPSKNLGAYGDGGAIVTDDEEIAKSMRMYRNYGSEKRYYNKVVGANSRLDELQAGLLRVRLKHLPELTEERRKLADRYSRELHNERLLLPRVRPGCDSVWHQYVIRTKERERLMQYLDRLGIGTIIHYPIPPHLSQAYTYLGHQRGEYPITEEYADTVLSIPMYNGMTAQEQGRVIEALNSFSD